MFVGVLQKLNKLDIEFQYDMVDITTISGLINIIISNFIESFFSGNGPMFGRYKQEFGKILEGS
jgi:hypothetical protein